MFITSGPSICFGIQSRVSTSVEKSNSTNKGISNNWQLSSRFSLDYLCWWSWEFPLLTELSFTSGRKLDAGYDLFILRNEKLDMVGCWGTT